MSNYNDNDFLDDYLDKDDEGDFDDSELDMVFTKVDEDNVDIFVDVFSQECPNISLEEVRKFFYQEDIFGVQISFKDLTSKFDHFLRDIVDTTLLDMVQEGILEMGYNEDLGEPIYWVKDDVNKKIDQNNSDCGNDEQNDSQDNSGKGE